MVDISDAVALQLAGLLQQIKPNGIGGNMLACKCDHFVLENSLTMQEVEEALKAQKIILKHQFMNGDLKLFLMRKMEA